MPHDSAPGDANAASRPPPPEKLDEAECLRLISPGGVGRLAYSGRFGLTVLPVNYVLHEGTIVFRTGGESATAQDLRTGIKNAEYRVAFEIDELDTAMREGWSVLIRGAAHEVVSEAERADAARSGVEPWVAGLKELYVRILPAQITGRRIRRA